MTDEIKWVKTRQDRCCMRRDRMQMVGIANLENDEALLFGFICC
jgi:hypothetical protein